MQEEALLDIRKRPSRLQKGVSLISKYNYLYSHLSSSHILLVVFTPLSIRRGDGGEAVSLISKYNYLYSHLPSSHILLAVFTPLSIRRGDGGEAVDGLVLGCSWTEVRLLLPIKQPIKRRTPRALLYRTLGVATLLKYSFNNKNYYYLTLIVPNLTTE